MSDDAGRPMIKRQIDTEQENPAEAVAETVAEAEGVPSDALTPIWQVIDHMVDELFSSPPAPEANVEVIFSYEGYRITVRQNGELTLVGHD